MTALHRALSPVVVAAADLGVGVLLYQEVSAPLGGVLLAAGLLVLCTIAYETLSHGGSVFTGASRSQQLSGKLTLGSSESSNDSSVKAGDEMWDRGERGR